MKSLGPLSEIDGYMAISAPFEMSASVSKLEKSFILDQVLKGGLRRACLKNFGNEIFNKAVENFGLSKGK